MQILFINNDGGGFADRIDIANGTTVAQLFAQRLPGSRPQDYLIRVNRQPTTSDAVLHPNDRVSITPTKIEGALHGAPRNRSRLSSRTNGPSQEFHGRSPQAQSSFHRRGARGGERAV